VSSEPRTTFFTGKLLSAEDLTLEQDYVRGTSREVVLSIAENGAAEEWVQVASLAESGPADRHFTLEPETGKVVFGDGEHGRRPAAGSSVEAGYRRGSGRRWHVLVAGAALAGLVAGALRARRP
jgi:hypothetical protein